MNHELFLHKVRNTLKVSFKKNQLGIVLYLPSSSSQVWGLSHDFLLILVHKCDKPNLSFSLGAKGHYCIFFSSQTEKVLNSIHF